MKKIPIIIMLLFSTIVEIEAQYIPPYPVQIDKYKTLDSAYLRCTYKLTYIKDTVSPNKKVCIDIQTLLIGSKISKYFSQNAFEYNLKYQKLNRQKGEGISGNKFGTVGYEVFKNYPKGKFTVTDMGSSLRANYIYEEPIIKQQWEIINETDSILSYSCQKATTKFRGRKYEAWFTIEIPLPNGPWKFGGLPGLILKVSDLQQHYIFECISVESLKKKENINLYQIYYTHIDRNDLNKLYFRYHNNFVEFNKSMGVKAGILDSNKKEVKNVKLPYNPIELE